MPQYRFVIDIAATSEAQTKTDIERMTRNDTNKTVQVVCSEQRRS